jgi:glycosyltransferase involved in cell wall biosynthesis
MRQPVVSVIIPTHERAQYAVPTIRSMLALQGEVEVVVCDTSAEDLISAELHDSPHLSRLKLVRPGKTLSVVGNFNTALAAATGKYLTFIGDDDFVSAQIVTVAKWAKIHQIDAIKFSFPTLYFWPDFRHKTQDDAIAGTLRTSTFSGKVTPHDAKAAALQALVNFGGGVMEMPRAYAGLVSMDLVKRIHDEHGPLFGGVSPDIYSAFLISQEARKCVYIDYPVIVPGASGASTAGLSAKGKHVGALRDNAHIRPFRDLVWDERIPEFYSVPTVWSYSLLKAVQKHGVLTEQINFVRLYLKCLIFHRPFLQETLKAAATYRRKTSWGPILRSALTATFSEAAWFAKKVVQRLLQKIKKNQDQQVLQNLDDTEAASVAFQMHMSRHATQLELP